MSGMDKWLVWATLCIAGYLTILPMFFLVHGSFQDAAPGYPSNYTLKNYIDAVSGEFGDLPDALRNSLIFAFLSGLLSCCIGTALAWVTERTNTIIKWLVYASIAVSMVVPGILVAIAWVLLLSPNIGVINVALMYVLDLENAPFDVFSFGGMIWVFGTDQFPIAFLLMAAAFRSMDPSLEESAMTCGATQSTIFRTITLKLMLPAMLATWMILIIRGLETFEAPAILGLPVGIRLLATEIYFSTNLSFPPNYNLAATYGVMYVGIAAIGIYFYYRATKHSERFAVITGKGFRPSKRNMPFMWKISLEGFVLVILAVIIYLPLLILLYASFLPRYMIPSMQVLQFINWDNYDWLLFSPKVWRAFQTNMIVGFISATGAVLLTAVIGWILARLRFRGRELLDLLCFSPMAFPGIVFALSLMWLYLQIPVPIYGTMWILVIAFVSKFMPLALRANLTAIMQVGTELEEASKACGAGLSQTLRKILVPLILPGLFVSWLYVFSLTFKVLSIPVLLSGVNTQLVPLLIFDLYEAGEYCRLAALGILTSFVILCVASIAKYLGGNWGLEKGADAK
jgi:iron(III) transport system permease protein